MSIFKKAFSAFTGAPRLIGTIINPNKKVSDFKLFDNKPIKESIKEYTSGYLTAGTVALGAKGIADKVQKTPVQPKEEGGLGNLFGSSSLSGLLKSNNLANTGIDVKKILGIGDSKVGGSLEFGTQGQKNLWLPFAIVGAIVLVVFALRPKKKRR